MLAACGLATDMLGGGTEKLTPLLATLFTVTTTFPVVALAGSATVILVLLQPVGVAEIPLKVTLLVPRVDAKFVPVIVTTIPALPVAGERFEIVGGGTVKLTPLLATLFTVTTTFPVVAAAGTGTAMLVLLQLVGDAVAPLKVTVLVPCVAKKFAPVMVTTVPPLPVVGERLEMLGGMVKATPLLVTLFTVTRTFPVVTPVGAGTVMVVALQLVGIAGIPLKVTLLVPWVAPKNDPAIVTDVPAPPKAGERLEIVGAPKL